MYSYNQKDWKRCQKTVWCEATGHLRWSLKAEADEVWFAFFAPYPLARFHELMAACDTCPESSVEELGSSIEGRPVHVVIAGTGELKCWVTCRQHPGETMASWFAEGLLQRLISCHVSADPLVAQVLEKYTLYIVPNMNPDGSYHGHMRTNRVGSNLNREWADSVSNGVRYEAPTRERSPEVYYTLQRMDAVGCDAFIDVHGDETLPYNFISGMEGVSNWGPRLQALQGMFTAAYVRANSDMQAEVAYEPDAAGGADPAIASNQIAERFDCLSVTLEQPFKDCATNSDPVYGWSPARSIKLGEGLVDALAHVAPYVRATHPFWDSLAPDDAYICPTGLSLSLARCLFRARALARSLSLSLSRCIWVGGLVRRWLGVWHRSCLSLLYTCMYVLFPPTPIRPLTTHTHTCTHTHKLQVS